MWNGSTKSVKAIIFDLAYTLVEYRECSWPELWDRGLSSAHHTISKKYPALPNFPDFKQRFEELKRIHSRTAAETLAGWQIRTVIAELFAEAAIAASDADIDRFLETFYDPARDMMYLEDDTRRVLIQLKQSGIILGIISNTVYPARLHAADLKSLGLEGLFSFEVYSSSHAHRKPHSSIFLTGIEKTGVEAEEIIYVGDRYDADVLGAQAVGMPAILKYSPRQTYPDPLPADLPVIHSIGELTENTFMKLSKDSKR